MAVSRVDSETVSNTDTGTITLTATGTNRLILIVCMDGNNQETSPYTVTVDGTTPTALRSYSRYASVGRQAFILKDTDIIGTEVTVNYTLASNKSENSITAISFEGVDQNTPNLSVDGLGGFHSDTATNTVGGSDTGTMLVGWSFLKTASGEIDASSYTNQLVMDSITGHIFYGDAEVWTYAEGGSLSADFDPYISNTWILDGVQLLPAGLSGPIFTEPTVESKVGDVISIDANDWFTSSGGPLDTWTEITSSLPAGLSFQAGDTGIIEGTLSEPAGNVSVSVSCSDDNGTTQGDFTWAISNYSLKFEGTHRLESPSGVVINGNVSFSVYKGKIDTTLTGSPIHFPSQTVTNGAVTLTHTNLLSGFWTIFAQVDSDNTKLGASELSAE
jgi:hypothetical protein